MLGLCLRHALPEAEMRLSQSIVGEREAEAVRAVICEDGYLGMGAATRRFEEDIAAYLGIAPWQVISCNSGTASLHLAVLAAVARFADAGKLPPKPAIIVPTLTFVASFQAVLAGGCQPVACDVRLDTGTLDLEDAKARITENVIGVMHVDYASNPWHLEKVYEFGSSHGLAVIDDAAHAFGCKQHARKVGSFGDLVCFSFDGIKNITCGEGGCLIAFDRESARIAADARLLGVEGDTARRFAGGRTWEPDVTRPGLRYHMSNIMAAIGSVQLARLETEFAKARRKLYRLYAEALAPLPGVKLLRTDPDDYIVPHIMPVRILNNAKDKVKAALQANDVPVGMHYRPCHLLSLFGGGSVSLPNAEQLYGELVTLPLHPQISEADVAKVCNIIKNSLA